MCETKINAKVAILYLFIYFYACLKIVTESTKNFKKSHKKLCKKIQRI